MASEASQVALHLDRFFVDACDGMIAGVGACGVAECDAGGVGSVVDGVLFSPPSSGENLPSDVSAITRGISSRDTCSLCCDFLCSDADGDACGVKGSVTITLRALVNEPGVCLNKPD